MTPNPTPPRHRAHPGAAAWLRLGAAAWLRLGAAAWLRLGAAAWLRPHHLVGGWGRRLLRSAAVGVLFACPLGGALFASSVLYREPEFEGQALVSACIASALGYTSFVPFFADGGHSGRVLADTRGLRFASVLELPAFALPELDFRAARHQEALAGQTRERSLACPPGPHRRLEGGDVPVVLTPAGGGRTAGRGGAA